MIYRVHYPLITQDGHRDFATREEAEKFANERRSESRYQTIHAWRHIRIEEVETDYEQERMAMEAHLFERTEAWLSAEPDTEARAQMAKAYTDAINNTWIEGLTTAQWADRVATRLKLPETFGGVTLPFSAENAAKFHRAMWGKGSK